MKKIIILLLMFVSLFVNGQTIEQRIKNLEVKMDTVFSILNLNPVQVDTTLVKPTYEGIVLQDFNSDYIIFNSAIYINGLYNCYANRGGLIYLLKSTNGLNTWTTTLTNAHYGSFIFANGKYRGSYDAYWAGAYNSYFETSDNGINYTITALNRDNVGEDRTLLYNNGEYWMYVRYYPTVPRCIAFQKSTNFNTWTVPIKILEPDNQDVNKQFYSMSEIKTIEGFFGFLNVYRVGDNGQDIEQLPPYNVDEHTMDIQLVWSPDGIHDWERLNNRLPFITRPTGVMQMYANASVINNYVYIYTIEAKKRHTVYDNTHNPNKYYSSRYKISLTDLYDYKNKNKK